MIHDEVLYIYNYIYIPIGSMYGIYANIGRILMVNVTIYIAYMDPMGYVYTYVYVVPQPGIPKWTCFGSRLGPH